MMNISTQTKPTAQGHQLQHSRIFSFNGPSNSVVANMARQLSQQFKQTSNYAQLSVVDTKYLTRVRIIFHDGGLLLVQSMVNSLDLQLVGRLEQNELYFWKRDQGLISNA